MEHLFELCDVHSLSKFLSHSSDIVGVDGSGVVIVKQVEDFVNAVLHIECLTLVYLSPNRDVIPSKNSSKSTSRPRDSRSAIMLKMVGFLL